MTVRICLAAAVLVVAGAAVAVAAPFVAPPETDPMVPAGGWVNPFPYPRNVLIGFDTDPHGWPLDPNGPAGSLDMIPDDPGPGNYHLEGTLDDQLWESDYSTWDGQFDWIDTDDRFPGRQGLIGIDGGADGSITATIRLGNEPIARRAKHLWIEFEYYLEEPGSGWQTSLSPAWSDVRFREENLADGWIRRTWWFLIEPNPIAEDLTITAFTGAAGGVALADHFHIATESVPEPSAIVLLAFSGLGWVLCVRRWKRGR